MERVQPLGNCRSLAGELAAEVLGNDGSGPIPGGMQNRRYEAAAAGLGQKAATRPYRR